MRQFSNRPTLDHHRSLQPLEALEEDQETRWDYVSSRSGILYFPLPHLIKAASVRVYMTIILKW